ncbi:MAG: tetratricopeptide repeat protein [Candidatus Eremiobacteraeota bacterium]|nr:tetratricopeptide repeat protein [Candidatus Eremiobacteraeota bacterium]
MQTLEFKAKLYAAQHDDAKTSAAFDDAVVVAPTDDQKVHLMVEKAMYFADEKKYNDAETILKQVTTQFPKVAAGFVAYGQYFAAQRQWDKATAQMQAALALDPDNAGALMALGTIAAQNGKVTDAIGYLRHYTQVSPDAQGFAMLGQAYSEVRNYSGARDACGKSFEIQRTPETLACVGGADYELKNYKEAAQIFDAIDHNARGFLDANPQFLYIAAKSFQSNNECSKAVAAYKRLLPLMRKGTTDYGKVQKEAANSCSSKHAT